MEGKQGKVHRLYRAQKGEKEKGKNHRNAQWEPKKKPGQGGSSTKIYYDGELSFPGLKEERGGKRERTCSLNPEERKKKMGKEKKEKEGKQNEADTVERGEAKREKRKTAGTGG